MYTGHLSKATSPQDFSSVYFPSKVGGKPVWLSLDSIPSYKELSCPKCHEPMAFILQLYCSFEEIDSCYHRTIYLYCCRKEKCHKKNDNLAFTVLRCNLSQNNKFYEHHPVDPDSSEEFIQSKENELARKFPLRLCNVCGLSSNQKEEFCSKSHSLSSAKPESFLFPEFLLTMEMDDTEFTPKIDDQIKVMNNIIKKDPLLKAHGDDRDLDVLAKLVKENTRKLDFNDKAMIKLSMKIHGKEDQVLRYSRGGSPWVANEDDRLVNDKIPSCPRCNEKLQFEFQVLPQLLHFMNVKNSFNSHGIDWATLLIYTCPRSCSPNGSVSVIFLRINKLMKENYNYLGSDFM